MSKKAPFRGSSSLRLFDLGARRGTKIKPSILIIDDEESIRSLYQILLEREGFWVITATDGSSALEILKAEEDSPALVLLDCSMPQMDGVSFLEKLRKEQPVVFYESKIVGVTSYDSDSKLFQQIKKLAYDCRQKPANMEGVVKLVSDYLELSRPGLKANS